MDEQQPVVVEVLSTDSMSQVRDKLANAFNILPYQDESLAIYDQANDRLLDIDVRSQLDRSGWCRVNTVGQLRLGPATLVRVVLAARPLSERALPPGRRPYHLERRASAADAPSESLFRRLIAFRVRRRIRRGESGDGGEGGCGGAGEGEGEGEGAGAGASGGGVRAGRLMGRPKPRCLSFKTWFPFSLRSFSGCGATVGRRGAGAAAQL